MALESLAIAIGGTVAVVGFLPIYLATRTGVARLDRFRTMVSWAVARTWGVNASPEYARALMAILRNESGGDPNYYLGDTSSESGPSIGPFQILRATAKDLGLWKPPVTFSELEERNAYSMLAGQEWTNTYWAARVLKSKLAAAGGDLQDAIRRYNGTGPKADLYRDKAVAFMESTRNLGNV